MKIIYNMYRAGEVPYTEHAASRLPNPTPLEGEVQFIQAQDQQVLPHLNLEAACSPVFKKGLCHWNKIAKIAVIEISTSLIAQGSVGWLVVNWCSFIIIFQIQDFNPYFPSGLFHPYQLDESISKFRGVWCTF